MELILLFTLTLISSTTGNLRNILLVKGKKLDKYIITGIDACIYGFLLQSLTKDKTFLGILVFCLGKVISVYFTDLIFDKTSKNIYLVHLYTDSVGEVETWLLENQISFSTSIDKFLNKDRNKITIHATRQQYNSMIEYLSGIGIDNPTLDITEVKVKGKIKERVK